MVTTTPRPTVGLTVRVAVETRRLLEEIARERRTSMGKAIEQLIAEEVQRAGTGRRRAVNDG